MCGGSCCTAHCLTQRGSSPHTREKWYPTLLHHLLVFTHGRSHTHPTYNRGSVPKAAAAKGPMSDVSPTFWTPNTFIHPPTFTGRPSLLSVLDLRILLLPSPDHLALSFVRIKYLLCDYSANSFSSMFRLGSLKHSWALSWNWNRRFTLSTDAPDEVLQRLLLDFDICRE